MPSKKRTTKKELVAKRRKIPLPLVFGTLIFTAGLFFFVRNDHNVQVLEGLSNANIEKIELEKNISKMVAGYPIEKMVPYIVEKDNTVAAFLVSIAKKESAWGKRAPKYQGKDCYNYWGYRGQNRVGSGGHSCFNNPKEAVDTVATRIEYLVQKGGLDTPEEMIVWKCGSSCQGHSALAVSKWISDVDIYFDKLTKTFLQK